MTNNLVNFIQEQDLQAGKESVVVKLTSEYLTKLQILASDILRLYTEIGQAPGQSLHTSMSYSLCDPKMPDYTKLTPFRLPGISSVKNPQEILRKLQEGHCFDNHVNNFENAKTNQVYYEFPNKDFFIKQVRTPAMYGFRKLLGLDTDVLKPTYEDSIYEVRIDSTLSLCTNNDRFQVLNLNVNPHFGCSKMSGYDGKVLSLSNTVRIGYCLEKPISKPGKFAIEGQGCSYSSREFSEEDLDSAKYQKDKEDLIKRIITYELSEAGNIAPIAELLLNHLKATRNLLLDGKFGKTETKAKGLWELIKNI